MKTPDAIFCSDLHIRGDVPAERIDDYLSAQERKLDFIFSLAKKHNVPVFVAGDFGNKAHWKNWLLSKIIRKIKFSTEKPNIYTILGQHDLPHHNLKLADESGSWVLSSAGAISIIPSVYAPINFNKFTIFPFHYGEDLIRCKAERRSVALIHKYIYSGKGAEWERAVGCSAKSLMKKFPHYDVIVSGDNHSPFVIEQKGRLLINSGSMMRMTAGQIDHRPRVYLWYADENKVESIYLPIKQEVFNQETIIEEKVKKKNIEAFVKSIKGKDKYELTIRFDRNIKNCLERNKKTIHRRTKRKILNSLKTEEEK